MDSHNPTVLQLKKGTIQIRMNRLTSGTDHVDRNLQEYFLKSNNAPYHFLEPLLTDPLFKASSQL